MTNPAAHAASSGDIWGRVLPGTLVSHVFREHRIVIALSLSYIAVGGILLTVAGRPWPIGLVTWVTWFWLALSVPWLVGRFIQSPERARMTLAPERVLGALLVVLLVVPTQITFQSLKQSIGSGIGFYADPFLHRADMALHGGIAWRWFAVILAHPVWLRVIDTLYMTWFVALTGFIFWASWSGDRVRRQRALVALLLMWVVAGSAIAALGASAGPCYYDRVVEGPSPYATLTASLDRIHADGSLWARRNQLLLWDIVESHQWYPYGGVSAMPSLHVGMAVLWAIVAFGRSRVLGLALAAYALVIQVGSVALGWHYAVDGYVGALVAGLAWAVACNAIPDDKRPPSRGCSSSPAKAF